MAKNKKYTVKFKRRRQNKTDYKKRLSYLKSNKLRLVIRPKNKNIILQIIKYNPGGDQTLVYVHSKEIEKLGWKPSKGNIPSSYLSGLLLGKKALDHKIKEAILDIGLHIKVPKSRIYAALKGALDAGLSIPHSKEILPDEDTVSGKKITNYANLISKSNDKNFFSSYKKLNIIPEDIQTHFKEIKSKILSHRSA